MNSATGLLDNPIELGAKLVAARKSRNLSQEDVAKYLGVSRPIIVAIEKGTRRVKTEELARLATLFERPIHELVGKHTIIDTFVPQFRVTQSTEVTQEALASAKVIFQRLCEDYLNLEHMLNSPLYNRYPDQYTQGNLGPQAAAEEIANLERARMNLGQGPLANVLEIFEAEMGLRVFVIPIEEFRIAGMFAYTSQLGGCVLINGNHPITRQNWSAAHECAHFLTNRFSGEITVLLDYERKPRSEQFADCFAASFLMPAPGLRQRFRRMLQSQSDFTVGDLYGLADQYGVSVEAMCTRLEQLGCIKKGAWIEIAKGVNGARIRQHLGIPVRESRPLRLPDRYRRLAIQAFSQELITETELMRFLRCSRVEAREAVRDLTCTGEVDGSAGSAYQIELDFGEPVEVTATEKP